VSLQFRYKPGQDEVPGLEVMRRMRDMYVAELRTHLLSGLFQENPDDLDIYGEVYSNKIKLVVVNTSTNRELERTVSLEDFTQFTDRQFEGAGHPDDVESAPQDSGLKLPDPGTVMDDNPLMPRVQLTKRVREEEFRNVVDPDTLRETVSTKVAALSNDFVKEFLRVKTDKAMQR
jgi:hypothetical protein